jgi:hypothetical protein
MGCYPHFILPMRRSRGFASTAADSNALFRLAFASAAPHSGLTSPTTVSRRIIMQKARRHTGVAPIVLRPLVGVWFQVHCPPLGGGSSHRSLALLGFAIGRQGVLSLAGWAPQIRAGFHVSGPTQELGERLLPDAYGTITLCGRTFQIASAGEKFGNSHVPVLQPPPDESGGFGLVRVRSPLLTESLLLSFPPGTEMFQFPGSALHAYGFSVQ